jgi:hypothetical protein
LEKIACGDFFETLRDHRRQKARFLPPASSRSYARAGGFFETIGLETFGLHGMFPALSSHRRVRAGFPSLRGSL